MAEQHDGPTKDETRLALLYKAQVAGLRPRTHTSIGRRAMLGYAVFCLTFAVLYGVSGMWAGAIVYAA